MANTGTEYGAVLEALNEKMDRDVENRHSGVETVVEHWESSDHMSWYRKWSDGWVEQGIYVPTETTTFSTVVLPVTMRDTKYIVTFGISNSVANATYTNYLCINGEATKTTTGFSTGVGSSYTPKTFYVCGYAAS